MAAERKTLDRIIDFAGSTALGMSLLAALFVYLGVATLVSPAETAGPWAAGVDLYAAWPLKLLLGLLVTNILVATMWRLKGGWRQLGAWTAHLGVIVLAAGAGWFASRGVSGIAVASRSDARAPFGTVEQFFVRGTASAYAADFSAGQVHIVQSPLANLRAGELGGIELKSPIEGLSLSAVELLPSAAFDQQWRDDAPGDSPGASFRLADGEASGDFYVSSTFRVAAQIQGKGYSIAMAPVQIPASLPSQQGDLVLLGRNELTIFRADGKRQVVPFKLEQEMPLDLAGRQVKFTVHKLFSHLWRSATARPATGPMTQPALKIDIKLGTWQGSIWTPYLQAMTGAEFTGVVNQLPLPQGRLLSLQFAPQARALPVQFQVVQMPGSPWPAVAPVVGQGQLGQPQTCRLNQPAQLGPMRVFCGSFEGWPHQVVYQVATRPGIWAVWTGCILICLALAYSFFVKPILLPKAKGEQP